MKKQKYKSLKEPLLPEYDFSKGVRGKYVARYRTGSNVIVLDPDVASVFRDSKSVNQVLRPLINIIHQKG